MFRFKARPEQKLELLNANVQIVPDSSHVLSPKPDRFRLMHSTKVQHISCLRYTHVQIQISKCLTDTFTCTSNVQIQVQVSDLHVETAIRQLQIQAQFQISDLHLET